MQDTAERIEQILTERFRPAHLGLTDDSDKHVGHKGATSGGGHYHVTIVAEAFEGKSRLEQHRLVYDALRSLIGDSIHAIGLTTRTPSENEVDPAP